MEGNTGRFLDSAATFGTETVSGRYSVAPDNLNINIEVKFLEDFC